MKKEALEWLQAVMYFIILTGAVVVVIFGLMVILTGCVEECHDEAWRCQGNTLEQCFAGEWEEHTDCGYLGWVCCEDGDAGADCLPAEECP